MVYNITQLITGGAPPCGMIGVSWYIDLDPWAHDDMEIYWAGTSTHWNPNWPSISQW
jgi:hypothetical protein